MAHFAEIDNDGVVLRVLVVPDAQENRGQDYLANDCALGGTWVQTSYNARIRKNYAGIGMSYDAERDAFIPPKPFDSWTLNEEICQWEPPIPYPADGIKFSWQDENVPRYQWNEENLEWELVNV
jgi:hypothetical protein